jgi:5-methylcytosine-specific restriction endonuclease McrA
MMTYQEYLRSEDWHARAHAAKERAGWECALCPATIGLETHHRTYARLGHEDPRDLFVLCGRCHRRHHGTFDECVERQLLLPHVGFAATAPTGADLN